MMAVNGDADAAAVSEVIRALSICAPVALLDMIMLLPLIHRSVDVTMWLQYAVPIQAFSLTVATADGMVAPLFGGASH